MTLHLHTAPAPITLTHALAAVHEHTDMIAFLSSAHEHQIARWDGTTVRTPQGQCALDRAFAARLFDEIADLRWRHDHGGLGTTVMLTEDDAAPTGWDSRPLDVDSTVDGQYALWGRRFDPLDGHPGWCRALEGRLNWIDLPHPVPAPTPAGQDWPTEYLCLRYREYLTADDYGNLHVLDERLLGIAATGPTNGTGA